MSDFAATRLPITTGVIFIILFVALSSVPAQSNQNSGIGATPNLKSGMSPQRNTVSDLTKQITDLFEKGDYDKALEVALKADVLLHNTAGFTSDDSVQNGLVLTKIYLAKKLPEQAEKCARESLALWSASAAKSADQLSKLYDLLIRSVAAEGKNSQVLELVEGVAVTPIEQLANHELEAGSMFLSGADAARALKDAKNQIRFLKLAMEVYEAALDKREEGFKKNLLLLALNARALVGHALTANSNYSEAIKILSGGVVKATDAGLHDMTKRFRTSRGYNQVMLGEAQVESGHVQEGIATLAEGLEQADAEPVFQILGLVNLLGAYNSIGDSVKAQETSAKMLEVSIKAGRFDEALTSLQTYAGKLCSAGRLIEARECLANALRALEIYPEKFHTDRFLTFSSLAKVYCRLWEMNRAGQAMEDAWKALPKAASNFSLIESNLAVAGLCGLESELSEQINQSDLQLKWALKRHALTTQYAKDNPSLVAESFLSLGQAYSRGRDFPKAMTCLASAKTEAAKLPQPNHDLNTRLLDRLALVYSEQGDLDNAVNTRSELLVLAAQKFGKADTRYFGSLLALAGDLFRKRAFERAGELCLESQLLYNEHAWRDLAFRQPGRKSGTASERIELPHLACSVALSTTNQAAIKNAAYVLTLSKGLETEVWAAQAMLSPSHPAEAVRRVIEEYWSSAGIKGGRIQASEAYRLREKSSVMLMAMLEGSRVSFDEVQKSIPADAVLIDFARFWRHDSENKTDSFEEEHYAAMGTFPLARDSTNVVVERVDLGEAAPINEAVELVCKRMSAGQFAAKDLSPALQRLSQLVYAPLAPYLTNVSHLIVCPDGQLSRLPFEMLSVGNKFLVEEKTISYVTSGREVVRIAKPLTRRDATLSPSDGERAGRGAVGKSLVMGNPDFDLDFRSSRREEAHSSNSEPGARNTEQNQSLLTSAATRALSRDFRGRRFNPLPGSGIEATNVAKLLGADASLRLGAEASKANLKATVSPRVLHLATHGFYLRDQEMPRTNSPAWDSAFTRPQPPKGETPNDWENPLVRCGIALAGANHYWPITNAWPAEGSLTGLEASLLNLQGTELVILSACQSGEGEVKIGEGVMSLRRAFRIAGAESVLASHWKVSDPATSRLMTEFMRRWRAGEPRAKAWREAQLSLLWTKGATEDFSNPFFWAAFTLTGQWN